MMLTNPQVYTNEELIDKIHKEANNLSYFNAAEGRDWGREEKARWETQELFKALESEAKIRNLTVDLKGYLL